MAQINKTLMSKVMVFGSFDSLHPGHLYVFSEAKKMADKLIVVVARDATIKRIKGEAPRYNEKERLYSVRAIPSVDEVFLGSLDDEYEMIRKVKPDVICLGHDQQAFTENLKSYLQSIGIDAEICRLDAYKRDVYRSSRIKKLDD